MALRNTIKMFTKKLIMPRGTPLLLENGLLIEIEKIID
jgi:hypothetical protein